MKSVKVILLVFMSTGFLNTTPVQLENGVYGSLLDDDRIGSIGEETKYLLQIEEESIYIVELKKSGDKYYKPVKHIKNYYSHRFIRNNGKYLMKSDPGIELKIMEGGFLLVSQFFGYETSIEYKKSNNIESLEVDRPFGIYKFNMEKELNDDLVNSSSLISENDNLYAFMSVSDSNKDGWSAETSDYDNLFFLTFTADKSLTKLDDIANQFYELGGWISSTDVKIDSYFFNKEELYVHPEDGFNMDIVIFITYDGLPLKSHEMTVERFGVGKIHAVVRDTWDNNEHKVTLDKIR